METDAAQLDMIQEFFAALRTDNVLLNEGDDTMLPMDIPISIDSAAMIVAVGKAEKSAKKFDRVLGLCQVISNNGYADWDTAAHIISPVDATRSYFAAYENRKLGDHRIPGKMLTLSEPKHGSLVHREDGVAYSYVPEKGFFGTDSVVATVEFAGYRVKLLHTFKVVNSNSAGPECGKRTIWRISQPDAVSGNTNLVLLQASDELSASLTNASQSLAGFQNLPGASLGQTTHQGYTAQITLDTTAAGYGWYIDPTPLDNTDDYLPTSNPNLWQAKAGSAAFGKMDMVSVLLHEYGHALGLEHSADAGDFMAATLLPSRPGAGFSALLRCRLRGNRFGGWTPEFNSLQMPYTAPQFDIAAHLALVNAQLTDATGCED